MKRNLNLVLLLLLITQPAHAQWYKDMQEKWDQTVSKVTQKDGQTSQATKTPEEAILEKREKLQEADRKARETGVAKTYYDKQKKKLKTEQTYKRGELHGASKTYRENGKLKSEGQYIRGRKEGIFKTYSPEGKLSAEALYENGILMDKRLYDDKGKLKSIVLR